MLNSRDRNKFGYVGDTVMGGSDPTPRTVNVDGVLVWLNDKEIDSLVDGDIAAVDKRYNIPFRADAYITRDSDGCWGVAQKWSVLSRNDSVGQTGEE